jgi:hypothetical protein
MDFDESRVAKIVFGSQQKKIKKKGNSAVEGRRGVPD